MGTHTEPALVSVVDLRQVRIEELAPLLEEEVRYWRANLDWDYRPSADLILRFARVQAMSGVGLLLDGTLRGYCYHVTEGNKGLIGDLFVAERYRSFSWEDRLLEAVFQTLAATAGVERIEAQLMTLLPGRRRPFPGAPFLKTFPRSFMKVEARAILQLPPSTASATATLEPWMPASQEIAAQLIASCYRDHIDAEINDQYRSVEGARRFLHNIIQYPGCGNFVHFASFLALDRRTAKPCGMSLASLIAGDVGHITQVCVTDEYRGRGIGYMLVRQSLLALAQHGCRSVSLTVTSANAHARQLYERMGFRTQRTFPALVWEGFRPRA